jgi:hypothetical protein
VRGGGHPHSGCGGVFTQRRGGAAGQPWSYGGLVNCHRNPRPLPQAHARQGRAGEESPRARGGGVGADSLPVLPIEASGVSAGQAASGIAASNKHHAGVEMIDERLVREALLRVETGPFERFGQTFYGAVKDREFLPLGGFHDGGADGFVEVYGDETEKNYIQITKQQTTTKKIRDTVQRLREYGRDPSVVTLITSQIIKDINKAQSKLSAELNLKSQIRDANFIVSNINSAPQI